jgi:CHAD domain-containing protein
MLYWVWNDKQGIDIKDGRKTWEVLSSIPADDADHFVGHIRALQSRLGSEGCFQAVQKYLKKYVPTGISYL